MLDYLSDLLGVIGRALRLDPGALDAAQLVSSPWAIPVGIVVLAVLSESIGQTIVLAINEVRGKRLAVTLTAAVLGNLLGYAVLGLAVAGAGSVLLGSAPDVSRLIQAVMVSAAPLTLSFLVLLPYSGPAVERFLQAWTMVALWGIVTHQFGAGRWTALILTAMAWLVYLGAMNLAARPLGRLRDRLWRTATGRRLALTSEQLLAEFPMPAPGEENLP